MYLFLISLSKPTWCGKLTISGCKGNNALHTLRQLLLFTLWPVVRPRGARVGYNPPFSSPPPYSCSKKSFLHLRWILYSNLWKPIRGLTKGSSVWTSSLRLKNLKNVYIYPNFFLNSWKCTVLIVTGLKIGAQSKKKPYPFKPLGEMHFL